MMLLANREYSITGDSMRIVFVQAGDFKEAVERFDAGNDETYSNQRSSVERVAELVSEHAQVIVICTRTASYDTILSNGVRAIGLDEHAPNGNQTLADLIKLLNPTHLIIRAPRTELIKLGVSIGSKVLPIFADSFNQPSIRERFRLRRLVRTLNDPRIEIVSNHNLNASRSLCSIGVNPSKVIPYDYARAYTPDQFAPKKTPQTPSQIRIIYVGVVSHAKGIFDVLDALPLINNKGIKATLTIVGDHQQTLDQRIDSLGLNNNVQLLGRQTNAQVIALMREHDAVIVPSRPTYPEGLPHTIFEALATRTPLIASDHPMFTPVLEDEQSCVMFKAGDPASIADATHRLLNTPGLYKSISSNTPTVWKKLMMPFAWHDIINLWLAGSSSDIEKLHTGSIQSLTTK
ncbi:glycosyl transferase family 1 [bacterium]|nr:MAG: glycosyl transferase family 1 [bacterium]